MIVLKILITVSFFYMAFSRTPVPADDPCPDDQNNCPNNSYCYIYSVTNQSYCAQSCDLNNGGCGTAQCVMVRVQCITAPCLPVVQCRTTNASEICNLPPVVGDCDAAIPRFFFNSTSQRCEMFTYGGCGGNANNFNNQTECARTCRAVSRPPPVNAADAACPDDQNNCPNNSYCYIYSVTNQSYCAQSCDLNNGGCGTAQCVMVRVQCITAPCPPVVQCHTRPSPYTCSLQPDSGACLAYFPSYFYNVTSRRCQKFVYGGCGGNDNRFSTSNECNRTCSSRSDNICELDPESGLCEAYIRSYFYNTTSGRCERFIYGRCGGNSNRFPTLAACQATCDIDVCTLQPETGKCRGWFPRYFYNQTTRQCELFTYGGCGGNGNRFIDVRSCEATCISQVTQLPPSVNVTRRPPINDTPCPDDQNNCPNNSYCYIYLESEQPYCAQSCDLNNGGCGTAQCVMVRVQCITGPCPPVVQCRTTSPYTCSFQPESGFCQAYFPSYFYNVTSRSCQKFVYGGCGGNDNRFTTSNECSRTCNGRFAVVNICKLRPESGFCEAYFPSYFYNTTSGRCERFIYGGCGGNSNRFPTLAACQTTCDVDVCKLQPEAGNCRGYFPRYFYNQTTRQCEPFIYGGCRGNGNRFTDVRSCKKTCISKVPTITPTSTIIPKRNIIFVTFDSYDGSYKGLATIFTNELMQLLANNGIKNVTIRIPVVSGKDNSVRLSVVISSDSRAIDLKKIAYLINQNKGTFSVAFSEAVVGDDNSSSRSDDSDGLSGGAIAGIVIGVIVGLAIVVILAIVAVVYFINSRREIPTKYTKTDVYKKSDEGFDNPVYSK